MKIILLLSKLWAWSLGLVLLWTVPALGQRITSPPAAEPLNREAVFNQLAEAEVIYLGETHDSRRDHEAQLDIIQSLYRKNPHIAIALEMFQRPYQSILDRYLAGKLTEAEVRDQSQYDQRWGFPWDNYAPILRFAKEKNLPLIALNTPTEVTRKVARQGLESLGPGEREWIPPLSEINTQQSSYRQRLLKIYQDAHQHSGSADNFEHFFQAQVLWDETMAAGIAKRLKTHPKHLVVVLAGQGHVIYGEGIPSRVARRMTSSNASFQQVILLLNPAEIDPDSARQPADYFWHTQPTSTLESAP
jgi:uncharacterized iron-regulated protein